MSGKNRDEKAFLFSVDKKKKYVVKEANKAVTNYDEGWVTFGSYELYLFNDKNGDLKCYSENGNWEKAYGISEEKD